MTDIRSMLVGDEDLRLMPYFCPSGFLTIGVGHNIEAHPLPADIKAYLAEHGCITEEMAFRLLDSDLERVTREARSFPWYPNLSDNRKAVIIDMIFNMGVTKFKGFKRTIAHIAAGNYQAASIEMMNSDWSRQVGKRADRLSKMMRAG